MMSDRILRVEKAMRALHLLLGVCRTHGQDSTVYRHTLSDSMPDMLGALEAISKITLCFIDERILLGDTVLQEDDLRLRQLARLFAELNVGTLVLRSGLRSDEVSEFVRLISEEKEAIRQGGAAVLQKSAIRNLEIDVVGVAGSSRDIEQRGGPAVFGLDDGPGGTFRLD
jgi:hypothetical protein